MSVIATKYPFIGAIESRVGGREENQDYAWYTDTPLGLLLVVCDGMGGGPGGRTASHTAVDIMLNTLEDVSPKTQPGDALRFAIEKANEALYNMGLENAELRGMGTTVVAMLINEASAVVAHVGDSRLYQLRRGRVVFRTADHSQVAELVRSGRLTEEEARNHPRSNIITRALGIRPTIEIEIDQVDFHAQDRFLLCSDGVWGMMPQPLLIKQLTRPMGIVELAELIVADIDRIGNDNGGGHDNLTLALLDTQCGSVKKSGVVENSIHDFETKDFTIRVVNHEPSTPHRGGWSYKHSFWTLLAAAVLGTAFFMWRLYQPGHPLSPLVEDTVSLPQPKIEPPTGHGTSSTEDTVNDQHQLQDKLTQKLTHDELKNESMDPIVRRKVDSVLLQLDELKRIQGNSKKEGREKKLNYIKGIQRKLKSIPLHEGKQISSRNEAHELLKSSKAYDCDKNGKSTRESNDYIEKKVKRKVRAISRQ